MIECEFRNAKDEKVITLNLSPATTISEIIKQKLKNYFKDKIKLKYLGEICQEDKTLGDFKEKKLIFYVIEEENYDSDEYDNECYSPQEKEINIHFLKVLNQSKPVKYNIDLYGLLKLCLLKEIVKKLDNKTINNLEENIRYVLLILKLGQIDFGDVKIGIKKILEKMEGGNILCFSKYVNEIINRENIINLINTLNKKDKEEIEDIYGRLLKYNEYIKIFEKEFAKANRESYFDYSIISMVVIEREKFDVFENERSKCPNRIDRVLFHGTAIEPISCILTDMFRKSTEKCYQHGKGVYFTDTLDYCWYYGGEENNRINKNKIPKINDKFSLIASSIYYNKNGFKRVYDYKYTPKKNEINFAYAGSVFETIHDEEPDRSKFVGTEYVIWDLDQICPYISCRLKRNEYCVVWRDNNFSSKPVYNNNFDAIFKNFLKERIKFIEKSSNFNIYICETSEEALKLIKKKKYNKIILLSNVGTDLGGKEFVINARKIIGNDVIALFLAYNIRHLNWIKNFKNALFSNEPTFYEDYLNCFESNGNEKYEIKNLKSKIEKKYKIQFNFDENFLTFPNFKSEGKFSDLTF